MARGSLVQMNTTKFFAKDILTTGTMKDTTISIAGHAAVRKNIPLKPKSA
jgi:hypothetical protein